MGEYAAGAPEAFETVVAHEVAHLWWGAIVGVDSNDHGFMNEGLATYSAIEYQGWTEGAGARAAAFEAWALGPAWALLERGDAVVDLPARDEQDATTRSWAVYGKATLGFVAIREAIGVAAFEAGLRAYAEEWAFGIAEPADRVAALTPRPPLPNSWERGRTPGSGASKARRRDRAKG
jgi:aminopeptidase N